MSCRAGPRGLCEPAECFPSRLSVHLPVEAEASRILKCAPKNQCPNPRGPVNVTPDFIVMWCRQPEDRDTILHPHLITGALESEGLPRRSDIWVQGESRHVPAPRKRRAGRPPELRAGLG